MNKRIKYYEASMTVTVTREHQNGDFQVKRLKGLDEIHEIIEKISDEEKGLTAEQRIKKLREEAVRFLLERNLELKRVKPKEISMIGISMQKIAYKVKEGNQERKFFTPFCLT
jgi:hypothetical protein